MRLLNVFTGKLEEYFGSAIPKYAILSHTWGRDEVTFSDIQNVGNGAQATDTGSSGMETCSEPPIAVTITSTEATRKEDEAPETDARVAVPRARDFVSESQDLALEAQSPIPEPSSPQGPIYEEKRSTEMQNLVMKYKKVKMFYFDKTVQVKQLQDKLKNEPLNKGLLDRIQHFDSDHMYSIEVGSDYERLLSKYKIVKTLYFRRQAQLEFLQKVLERWTSPRTGENVPVAQNPSRQSKAGYKKVRYACEQAISDDYEYVWIDTCCIDKSSSAELSEAIHFMFQWYQNAGVCYAYVEDVQLENFGTSRWFTRGWTLQELLAPAEVIFFGSEWTRLGTKSDLANQIITVTRIDEKALLHQDQLKKKSVAQRMSWASRRETTRLEDAAYCLLGIFGVNMPLLYGEGKNAFFRLQEELWDIR
ncbi:hypothetical protein NA56DRAFT_355959 [Hyaloscypha hepaticicola]|uniref:Heterokaryon incompatibility domain-containing protein n=1 Tax=Hyaloscypha hepaticicola TaxID=2082293 RepID=A0A2J6PLZ9_9HELO|nr:hypothetical protein NA56DRAFT_355959 [Hyaloscypha hepaticicola]